MSISVTLSFISIIIPVAVTLRCYWCSGVGQQRECERTPSDVTTGPVFINCKTKYCVSTKVMDADTGHVRSFARLCANVPRGNVCVRDARFVTCFETCAKDFCNNGNPDPSTLGTRPYSGIFLGLPPIEPQNFRNRKVPRFPVPSASTFITSSKLQTGRTLNDSSKKDLSKRNGRLKEVLSDGEKWTLPDIQITAARGNTKLHERTNNQPLPRKAKDKRWFDVNHSSEKGEPLDDDSDGYDKDVTFPSSKHPLILAKPQNGHIDDVFVGVTPKYNTPDNEDRSPYLTAIPFPVFSAGPSPLRAYNYTNNIRDNHHISSKWHPQNPTMSLQNNERKLNVSIVVYSNVDKLKKLKEKADSNNSNKNDTNVYSGQPKIESLSPLIHVVHVNEPYHEIKGLGMLKSSLFHIEHLNIDMEDSETPLKEDGLHSLSKDNDPFSTKVSPRLSNEMNNIVKNTTDCKSLREKNYISNRGKLGVSFLKFLALTLIDPNCSNALNMDPSDDNKSLFQMGNKIESNIDMISSSEVNLTQPYGTIDNISFLGRSNERDVKIDIIPQSRSVIGSEADNDRNHNESPRNESENGAKNKSESQRYPNKGDKLRWNDVKVPQMPRRLTSGTSNSSNRIIVPGRKLEGNRKMVPEKALGYGKFSRQARRLNQYGPVARAWQRLALLESSNKIESHHSTLNGRHSNKNRDQRIDSFHLYSINSDEELSYQHSQVKPRSIATTEKAGATMESDENDVSKRFHLEMVLSMTGQNNMSLGLARHTTTSKPIKYRDTHGQPSHYHQIPPKGSRKRYPAPRIYLPKSPLLQLANLQAFDSSDPRHISHWLLSLVVVSVAFRIFAECTGP